MLLAPRWPDAVKNVNALRLWFDAMNTRPGYLIRRAQQIASAVIQEGVEKSGLTPAQSLVIQVLGENPGIDQTTVAKLSALDRSTAADVVRRLEKRGVLRREPGQQDKRQMVLWHTELGAALNQETGQAASHFSDRFLAPLKPHERAYLTELLAKLIDYHESEQKRDLEPRSSSA